MKKVFKVIGWSALSFVGLCVVLVLLARFAFREQLLGFANNLQNEERLKVLRAAGPYAEDAEADFNFTYQQDSVRAAETRTYFRLDTVVNPRSSAWENTVALAEFVARHIPHANQTVQPKERNAIALWEYHLEVEPAFNCRLHAIMLHELLLASGITNRFVTCMPADSTDTDCHVVNVVWLPEREKWAMIDSDGCAYVTDTNGTPLSLEEMRHYTLEGKEMEVHPLRWGKTYGNYLSYWAKNLYWFSCWEETGYDKEPQGKGRYIHLLPQGFAGFNVKERGVCTTDASRFWAAPDQGE